MTHPNENEAREALIALNTMAEGFIGFQPDLASEKPWWEKREAARKVLFDVISSRDSEKRRADEAEAELARVREALEAAEKAMDRILPYLIWTVGDESPGHHPTLPSAVGAFKYSLNEEVRKALPLPTPPERA